MFDIAQVQAKAAMGSKRETVILLTLVIPLAIMMTCQSTYGVVTQGWAYTLYPGAWWATTLSLPAVMWALAWLGLQRLTQRRYWVGMPGSDLAACLEHYSLASAREDLEALPGAIIVYWGRGFDIYPTEPYRK